MRRTDFIAPCRARGVTLIEMIVAIVVASILIALVGMFTRNQITAYFDVAGRAELADAADTALRRIARDVQAALPNSVRVSADGRYLEFVPIRDAGRYRARAGGGGGDPLDFGDASDKTFDVLGPPVAVAAGDSLVIYNLGIDDADVYSGDTRRALSVNGAALSALTFTGASFALASPQSRFQIVSTPVTYRCDMGARVVRRHWGYAFSSGQPQPPSGGSSSLLVDSVSDCSFAYASGAQARNGLLSLRLALTRNGETVSLLHQVNVINTP